MNRLLICVAGAFMLSGCSGLPAKQEPICSGTVIIGGQENTVQIYGVRKQNNQTQYRAGYPFNWRWVSKNNFISSSCSYPEK
ncbi:cor protein [Salmonella enterica subsp. salamae]|nr:cor protein [Salmonella enterica subsp. salamae]